MSSFVPDILTTVFVEEFEREQALKILDDKHSKGKSYEEITGIADEYYLEKIRKGYVKMSAYVYYKITELDPNGELVKVGNSHMRLRKCIRCGRWTQLKSPYCRICSEKLGRVNHTRANDSRDGGVVKQIRN